MVLRLGCKAEYCFLFYIKVSSIPNALKADFFFRRFFIPARPR